jgi:ABC-2 type transport system ATP-binding protein
MTAALTIRGITKSFGKFKAVDDVSFEVQRGEIYGFIGPNGAGKTTTMRVCSTLEVPDSGDVLVDGVSVVEEPRIARARIGFMPDSYGAYSNMTVLDYLDFFARAYGLRGERRRGTIAQVVDFTGLAPLAEKEITALSKGMKQRLCLAKTLLHDPAVLILDEPAAGLDPRARVELRELVKALAQMGKALLISSHILTELSEMCTGVAVIEHGKIRGTGSVAEVVKVAVPQLQMRLRALAGEEAAERALLERPRTKNVRRERGGVVFDYEGSPDELAALLAELVTAGLKPVEFAARESNLEDIFMSLTGGKLQ